MVACGERVEKPSAGPAIRAAGSNGRHSRRSSSAGVDVGFRSKGEIPIWAAMSALVEQPAPLHNTVIVICSSAPSTGRAVLVVVLSAQQLPGRLEELT